MPRVSIKRKEYKLTDFKRWLVGEMAMNGYRQRDLAEWLSISQPAVSQKIKKCDFSVKDLIIIFEKLDVNLEEVGKLFVL